ncbi:MAG: helix-turn-helix domain-containing protein [Planctomycetaceae bacterium]|nr:helix-turn-helix domain-containing protein [Planctomycetaceae bacterium]
MSEISDSRLAPVPPGDFPLPAPQAPPPHFAVAPVSHSPGTPGRKKQKRPLHRIAEVRKAQGVSLTNIAKHLDMDITAAQLQENPFSDLSLSRLYQWRELLDVPIAELLVDPDELFNDPLRSRAALVRIMKTVRSILEKTREHSTRFLAQTLFDQLVEIMPELREIPPWPNIGQSREFKDYGQALYRRFDREVDSSLLE